MTREELKAHCKKEIEMCEFWARGKDEELDNNKIYQEHKLILELLEQETRWIPVSERLPEKEKEVLVSGYDTYGKKIIIARYQGEQYGFTCGLVPAWMPLPKPYKAESEGKE